MLISDGDDDGGDASKDGGSDDGDGSDDVHVIASAPRRLNFLCLVSFDRIPTLYHCNTKVSSGSQMVTAK